MCIWCARPTLRLRIASLLGAPPQMQEPPPAVAALLSAGQDTRDEAWESFLAAYSPVLMAAVERVAVSHDEAMDHYAFVLDRLREEDFRRVRAFASNGAATFDSWLGVVAKRLSIDHHRRRVGRPQAHVVPGSREELEWMARRNLARLVADDVEALGLRDERASSPEDRVVAEERRSALVAALGELDERDRLLLTLRFEDGFPHASIAAALNMPTRFHVHRRLKKVLETLRHSLERRGVHGT